MQKLRDYQIRRNMSTIGRKLVDGKGALRVVKEVIKKALSYP